MSAVIAFAGPDFNGEILGVFTNTKMVTTVATASDEVEILPTGQVIHPDLVRALNLSGETGTLYGVTPCGVIKVITHEEFLHLPEWAADASTVVGVSPV